MMMVVVAVVVVMVMLVGEQFLDGDAVEQFLPAHSVALALSKCIHTFTDSVIVHSPVKPSFRVYIPTYTWLCNEQQKHLNKH